MEIYVDVSPNARMAGCMMRDFMEKLRKEGVEFRAYGNQRRVVAEGKEYHFITDEQYPTWRQGRTYFLYGKRYKGGYPVEQDTLISAT